MAHSRLFASGADGVRAALAGRTRGITAPTSGSTGNPREVRISSAALTASATATLDYLGGPGHWLLALPDNRIAGAMVHARAIIGGTEVIRMDAGSFTSTGFAAAAARMPRGRRYVSLVPTQVRRLLADATGVAALATFDAVLVGGAPPDMDLPANAIETYGMTETSGGCVYNGSPLAGVEVRIGTGGTVELSGPMLADGYVDGDDSSFVNQGGRRWFRTTDLGEWDGKHLSVHGRSDHVIITGGHNVHPASVEQALRQHPTIADAVVTSVPDVEWGNKLVALVVAAPGATPEASQLRAELNLPRHTLPQAVVSVGQLPYTDAGKIDRDAARTYATHVLDGRTPEENP